MTSRRKFENGPDSIPDPFSYTRRDAQIYADLAIQLREIIEKWERQLRNDKVLMRPEDEQRAKI